MIENGSVRIRWSTLRFQICSLLIRIVTISHRIFIEYFLIDRFFVDSSKIKKIRYQIGRPTSSLHSNLRISSKYTKMLTNVETTDAKVEMEIIWFDLSDMVQKKDQLHLTNHHHSNNIQNSKSYRWYIITSKRFTAIPSWSWSTYFLDSTWLHIKIYLSVNFWFPRQRESYEEVKCSDHYRFEFWIVYHFSKYWKNYFWSESLINWN